MKKIDLYIIKKFLSVFFFVVFLLVLIICVIDYTEKNDDFMEASLSAAQIGKYYMVFIPFVSSLITPITVFIAVVFVTSNLAKNTEIIAILAGGVSFRRLMVPYIISAAFITALSFYLNGWVIPNANKIRVNFENTYLKDPFHFDENDVHLKIAENSYAYIQSYNNQSEVGYHFTLEKVIGNELKEKLSSRRIQWDSAKDVWTLKDWNKRVIEDEGETMTNGESLDTTLNLKPSDFESKHKFYETLTLNELNHYISTLKERGSHEVLVYQVEEYIRYMTPFTAIILTVIGMVMSSKKQRGGSGFQIALGFLLAFVFIIFFIFARSIAEAGTMDPLIAVWIPNIVFSVVAVVLYQTVPK